MSIKNISDEVCCGCGLCLSVCPRKCIKMNENEEGFFYPSVDLSRCNECGLCEKVCLSAKEITRGEYKDTYVGYCNDENIRKTSSSGGLFYLLAKKILNNNGVVYGAAVDSELKIRHTRAENVEQLKKLMQSKYVQSSIGECYEAALKDLEQGKEVLFSGTPCQIEAMKKYAVIRHNEDKLFLVDFVCHGVPSPGVWQSYTEYVKSQTGELVNSRFRNKKYGWHNYHMEYDFGDGVKKYTSHETDPYMVGFLSDKNLRKSCYNCKNKGDNYFSDITLGDAWKIEKDCGKWNDDKGVSLYIVRTEKGKSLMDRIDKSEFEYISSDYNRWLHYNPSLVKSTVCPEGREEYFDRFNTEDNYTFWKKNSKLSTKKKMRYFIKKTLGVFGIDKLLRRLK